MIRTKQLLFGTALGTGLVLACTSASAATLLHHWTFDTDGTDSVGSANATVEAGAAITAGSTGQFGEALSTPSTAAGAVIPAATSPVVPVSDYTFTVWVNPDSNGSPTNGFIMGDQAGGSAKGSFIRVDNEGNDGDAFARVNNGPGALVEGGAVPFDTWTHITMTVSSTAGLTIYVNGAFAGNDPTGTSHIQTDPGTGFETFEFGTRPSSGIQSFYGMIDDAAIFDGVLTQQEIDNVRNLGAQNFDVPEPGSLALLGLGGLLTARRRRG